MGIFKNNIEKEHARQIKLIIGVFTLTMRASFISQIFVCKYVCIQTNFSDFKYFYKIIFDFTKIP